MSTTAAPAIVRGKGGRAGRGVLAKRAIVDEGWEIIVAAAAAVVAECRIVLNGESAIVLENAPVGATNRPGSGPQALASADQRAHIQGFCSVAEDGKIGTRAHGVDSGHDAATPGKSAWAGEKVEAAPTAARQFHRRSRLDRVSAVHHGGSRVHARLRRSRNI